ncbi:hypothetical protein Tco_0778073 [Tanacetum coccineum]
MNMLPNCPKHNVIAPGMYKSEQKASSNRTPQCASTTLGNLTNACLFSTGGVPLCPNTPSSSNSFAARRDSSIHRRLWVLKAHDRGRSQTSNLIFVEKFQERVKFGKDHNLEPILAMEICSRNGYCQKGLLVEGLNHNLFSVGQFCDADLEVGFFFRKTTSISRDLKGNDLSSSRAQIVFHFSCRPSTPIQFAYG